MKGQLVGGSSHSRTLRIGDATSLSLTVGIDQVGLTTEEDKLLLLLFRLSLFLFLFSFPLPLVFKHIFLFPFIEMTPSPCNSAECQRVVWLRLRRGERRGARFNCCCCDGSQR